MSDSSHKTICPECQQLYDITSLATHLCFEHGFCPFCFSEECITEDLYPELTSTYISVVSRLSQIYRIVSNNLFAARDTGFSLEACSSIYSTYIATFSPLCKFSYGLPSPISMLVHMLIEHPIVGYRLLASLSYGESLSLVYTRVSCTDFISSGDVQLCSGCFLFYNNSINHYTQCKEHYRSHFLHYLHYRCSSINNTSCSNTSMHFSLENILGRYFYPESLMDNFQCAKRYMGLYTPPDSNTVQLIEDSLRRYITKHPIFESLKYPGETYKIESLELQGSYAFGKATIYSDMDFHLLILKSDGTDFKDLTSEDTKDCLSSLIVHLQTLSSDKFLSQFFVNKPVAYTKGTTGFIQLTHTDSTLSLGLVFGTRSHLITGRKRITIMKSFYADKYSIYERAEAFLKKWLFMSRTTEGSTGTGLTKFTSLTILQRICLFTDVGNLCRRFICYDPYETYEPMLYPIATNSLTSNEPLSLYQWNHSTSNEMELVHAFNVSLNSELVDPIKFKQLIVDNCSNNQSKRGVIDFIFDAADTHENVSFIWVLMLIHEVLRYHRDFYRETIESKLISNENAATNNILYKLYDLLAVHDAAGHATDAEAPRPCVSMHVTKAMTIAYVLRILLTVETSMVFLRSFLPTPPHFSVTDREALQSIQKSG